MSEVVVAFQEDSSMIGPELSRHGEQVTGHTKCSGHHALALMCATAVRAHLSPRQAASCEAYDRIGEPQEPE